MKYVALQIRGSLFIWRKLFIYRGPCFSFLVRQLSVYVAVLDYPPTLQEYFIHNKHEIRHANKIAGEFAEL